MARTRAALALVAVGAVAALALSGGSSSDPRTPAGLSGLPPPFQTMAVVGAGGLTAGIDAYGVVVDLRAPGPAGRALIESSAKRQAAGSVPADTGIVPRASVGGGPPQPLWRADSIRQSYLPDTDVLRTAARFGGALVEIECAADGDELGCVSRWSGKRSAQVSFDRHLVGGQRRVHLDDGAARRIVGAETVAGRRWIARARPLGAGAPPWAERLYRRSLLALRALTDRRAGAVAAGARDGWAYVWPRDAGAVGIALSAAGYRPEARRVARFLLHLDLDAAARFDGSGDAVEGREGQGDAAGWVLAAAQAAGVAVRFPAAPGTPLSRYEWRERADYQEGDAGDYLANAIASSAADGSRSRPGLSPVDREIEALFETPRGLVRIAESASGLDSAAAWAVRPFPVPSLFEAARRTLLRLAEAGDRFGLLPSESWADADPWTAPTAWSAWSLAALGERRAALRLLADLRRATTPAGLLPERVDARTGVPRSTTPLAWSHAFAVLALRELWP